ncbi:MAG: hypothetical protein Q8L85_01995, partial [Alphaproteobacteria bacterium]|nr:hypothetical protein [Alphaproteobacteria bacterium]
MLKEVQKSKIQLLIFITLALSCFFYALYIAIQYAQQIPLDQYSFRQTQTALTAYWLIQNGFSFAYETPIAGPPWSIPFEFPIYQYIVALVSKLTNISLDAVGRIVSFIFLALCLIPVRSITKNLNISQLVFYIFVALLFSSPLYLYWGRTFMIETAAIFFSIVSIKYFIDISQEKNLFRNSVFFVIFMTLAMLQKATTGLPILLILGSVFLFLQIKKSTSLTDIFLSKKNLFFIFCFGLIFFLSVAWTFYTDQIKELNPLGSQLTSSALTNWNWGTLNHRLSSDLYIKVIWERIFKQNLSGIIGIAILLFALFSNAKNQIKFIVVVSLLMGFIPLFLFPNLHIVHTYYQTANVIFIIYAISLSIGHILKSYVSKKIIVFPLALIMIGFNYYCFSEDYLDSVKQKFDKKNSRDYAVSQILKREVPDKKYFIAFGNLYSSSLSYLSERKSFTVPRVITVTVPRFFKEYDLVSKNPENYIKESELGAIVLLPNDVQCPITAINNIIEWVSYNRQWKIGMVHNCYILIPENQLVDSKQEVSNVQCQGNLDVAKEVLMGDHKMFSITGWNTISGENNIVPEKVYVTLTKENDDPLYFEALQINRAD